MHMVQLTRGGRLFFGPCHVKALLPDLAFNIDLETFAGFKCPVFAHNHPSILFLYLYFSNFGSQEAYASCQGVRGREHPG